MPSPLFSGLGSAGYGVFIDDSQDPTYASHQNHLDIHSYHITSGAAIQQAQSRASQPTANTSITLQGDASSGAITVQSSADVPEGTAYFVNSSTTLLNTNDFETIVSYAGTTPTPTQDSNTSGPLTYEQIYKAMRIMYEHAGIYNFPTSAPQFGAKDFEVVEAKLP